jgi:ArsR family transcriptional regulator, virulence genes transcriptional regulator
MSEVDLKMLCKALGNPERIRLLVCVGETEVTVSDLLKKCTLSQSALSQHLAKLRDAKILKVRRSGTHMYYSISNPSFLTLASSLHALTKK